LTLSPNGVKAGSEQDIFPMRGLLMALFAFDFPGHKTAGGVAARLSSTKTTAKKTTATTV
jgi:hypothetical protein